MTDAQIYTSFCKAHKLLCAESSVDSGFTASVILLSIIHSHLYSVIHRDGSIDESTRVNCSLRAVSSVCEIPFEKVVAAFRGINSVTLAKIHVIIDRWGLTFDVYENVFGSLFEKYITKKEAGAYYTAPITTEYITLRSLLTYLLQEVITEDTLFHLCHQGHITDWFRTYAGCLTAGQRQLILDRLKKVSIVDPTCGTGAFVVQAFKCICMVYRLLSVEVDAPLVRSIIADNLFGVDIDPEAVTILKFRFLIIAQSYGIDDMKRFPNFKTGDTLNSKSFDWSNEFKDVGKFDIVIGNPPYVECNRRQRERYDADLMTLKCGNLYAYVTEKAVRTILKEGGILGFIVPISVVSTARMAPLREILYNYGKECFYSHYADRPGCLFVGVHQKLTICLLVKSTSAVCSVYTSPYFHWEKENETDLFPRVMPYRIGINAPTDIIPKIGSDIESRILSKLCSRFSNNILVDTSATGAYGVWLNMRMCFWAKAFCFAQTSNEYKKFSFDSMQDARIFAAFMNSSLFFFFWETVSDCWHITSKEFALLKLPLRDIPQPIRTELCLLYEEFESELERTKRYIGSVQTEYIYQHKFHKNLIDRIDDLFGSFINLDESELDFIKSYQERYRLNTVVQKQ